MIFELDQCHVRGVTPLYLPYSDLPPQRVWFLLGFDIKMGVDRPFWSGIMTVWFSRKLPEHMNVFIVSIPIEQDNREICSFEMNHIIEKSFFVGVLI